MADAHKNFAYSLVATAPSPASSGTSLVVTAADGAKFPAAPFNATIWPASTQPTTTNAEIVRVTAISTDTLTITRAQESSSARTVVVGDQIAATVTAKTLTDAETAQGTTVATDTIWDTKGDIVVATGADAAAKLVVGSTFGTVPMADTTPSQGLIYGFPDTLATRYLKPTSSYETSSRLNYLNNANPFTSGTVSLFSIALPKNLLVTSISFGSATTPASSPTHWWFSLCNNAYTTLRSTADQTSTAWAANTIKTVNLSSTFTTTYEGLYYLAFMMTASTTITTWSSATAPNSVLLGITPLVAVSGITGQTTAPADSTNLATSPTAKVTSVYGYVS